MKIFDSSSAVPANAPGWMWVPGVYFAEGLPFAVATCVSIVIFSSLGMDNTRMALWTSLIALPWSVKFLWAPFVDSFHTKREWMLAMQFLLSAAFSLLALSFRNGTALWPVIGCFFFMAFCSATHDVAADGYYMIALDSHGQAFYSGFRNIFYKCAMIAGQGGLVFFAGHLQRKGFSIYTAWRCAMFLASAVMLLLFILHVFTAPDRESALQKGKESGVINSVSFGELFRTFFLRKGAIYGFLFLIFYRFAEAQLGKMSIPFMLGTYASGGLGMTIQEQGMYFGIAGTLAFLIGGFLSGVAVSRFGFGKCLWGMALALNAPDFLYILLAWLRPGAAFSGTVIALEQFGYGLGFMAHVLFMVQFAEKSGKYKTSHFAFMTGITIAGMTLVGMFSGALQQFFAVELSELLAKTHRFPGFVTDGGYFLFFVWIGVATIPSFLSVYLVKPYIDANFGKKK